MLDELSIYDGNNGKFSDDSAENIIRSIKNIVDIDDIAEIRLLSATPFTIENFLETKEQIANGTFKTESIKYSMQNDLLLFYQVLTINNKYYVVAHRDPFEIYYNQVIMWFHELVYNFTSIPNDNLIYKNPKLSIGNN